MNPLIQSLVASTLLLASHSAFAASATWTGATSGTWATSTNWSPTAAPGASSATASTGTNTDTATFNNAANLTTNYGSASGNDYNLGSILFTGASTGAFTIQSGSTGTGTNRLYFTLGGSVSMDSAVANAQTFARVGLSGSTGSYSFLNNASTSTAILNFSSSFASATTGTTTLVLDGSNTGLNTIAGAISQGTGALSITKQGSGTWLLNGANTFTGGVTVSNGILGLGENAALGGGVLTMNGGTLAASVSSRTITNNVTVGGDFALGGLSNSITMNGTMNLGGATRVITLGNSATIGGNISNGGLTVSTGSSTRTLTLSGSGNSYSGGTIITGTSTGGIVVGNVNALGSTTGALTINGGSLNLNGNSIAVGVLSGSGGTISTSSSAGTATLTLNQATDGTFSGTVADNGSGKVAIVKSGNGTLLLNTLDNSFSGGTTLNAGILAVARNLSLGTGTLTISGGSLGVGSTADRTLANNVIVGGNFSLGSSVASGNVTLGGTVDLGGTVRIITLATNSHFISGAISNGGLTLTSSSATRTLTFSGVNTYTGTTTINGGTLKADATDALKNTSSIVINGGTLLLGSGVDRINDAATVKLDANSSAVAAISTVGLAETVGVLTLSSNSVIDLGSANASNALKFSDSSSATWAALTTLSIWNWSGSTSGAGADQVFFGSNSSGLDTSKLAQISFFSGAGTGALGSAQILSTGEIVPVPETSTTIGGSLVLLAIAFGERKRLGIWAAKVADSTYS